jgi:hypothetical protein
MLGERGSSLARGTGIGLLMLEPLVVLALLWEYLDVYLTFGGDPVEASSADGHRYVVTVIVCLTCPVVALVAATLCRSRRLLWWAAAGLVVALAAGFLFAVPNDRFERDDPALPLPPDYTPCYSGSNDCPGG